MYADERHVCSPTDVEIFLTYSHGIRPTLEWIKGVESSVLHVVPVS